VLRKPQVFTQCLALVRVCLQVLKSRTTFEKACSRAVTKGEVLERDDTKAIKDGTLFDMIIVSSVKCPVSLQ
jgi:hypothetical protein